MQADGKHPITFRRLNEKITEPAKMISETSGTYKKNASTCIA